MPTLESFPSWLEAAVEVNPWLGYGVLGLAMLLENLIPPIPSELIQPVAGFLVEQGRLQLLPTILAGAAGTLLGCWFWYGVGRWIGEERVVALLQRRGGWLGVGEAELEAGRRWFRRHGIGLMVWGRMVPGIRTIISLPAGLEAMAQLPFLLATLVGSLLWVSLLTLAGRALGAGYRQVATQASVVGSVSKGLLLLLVLVAIVWLVRRAVAAAPSSGLAVPPSEPAPSQPEPTGSAPGDHSARALSTPSLDSPSPNVFSPSVDSSKAGSLPIRE